jgi:hypothetical protein
MDRSAAELIFDGFDKRQISNRDHFRPAIVSNSASRKSLLTPRGVGSLKIF